MKNADLSVIIINDDDDPIDTLTLFLKKIGIIHVAKANTISECEALMQSTPIDLVILNIDFGELETGIEKVQQAIELAFLQEKAPLPRTDAFTDDFIFVKVGTGFKKIFLTDIDYVVYENRYPNLVIGNKQFPVNITMKELMKQLSQSRFIQVHQSYIVNLNKITQINMADNEIEIEGKSLPIGIRFKKALQTRLIFLT